MNRLSVVNPATGQEIDSLPVDDAAAIAAKAERARAAQPAWAARPMADRLACIARFREAVIAERESLARTLTLEVGKPIRQARNELAGLLPRIDFFMQEAQAAIATETVTQEAGLREQIERVPLGVVANISAWNYPWFVGCNVLLPALLAGNAVLYKPSEYAALTGREIVRVLHAAGVPQDVLALVVGAGPAGEALLQQRLEGVFFTGSHTTGQAISRALGGRMVHLQLELGGKDPSYVCEDADVKAAAESLADGAMYNAGQSCCAIERIYVHESIHDAFVDRFVDVVRGLRIGDTLDESTDLGPLTRRAQIAVLQEQVDDAKARGGKLLLGGGARSGPGQWFEPTVFTDVNHDMLLMREESFGPVIGIQRVRSDDEAIALMNDTRYGLTAGVYTPDQARARSLLSRVNAGTVYWNCCDRVSPRLPWSGVGDSGIGMTLSVEGMRCFTRVKAWHLKG